MLVEAIRSGDFLSALAGLGSGERLPTDLDKHTKKSIYTILIEAKQFDILHLFAHYKIMETDIFEYDSFDYSFFDSLFNSKNIDEEINVFFDVFIGHFTNVNDEINGDTLLSYAFTRGANSRNIQALINFDCDVNFKNNENEDIVHQLIKADYCRYRYTQEDYADLLSQHITLLKNNGLQIDMPNASNETPLLSALRFRRTNLLPVLLENGANPNHTDNAGNNAFYYAIIWNRDLKAYKRLSEYAQPELNELNGLNWTVLFEYLAEVNFDSEEKTREIITQLIADGADLYRTCKRYGEEKTPLEMVAGKSLYILSAILDTNTINVNAQDSNGNTLLHQVCAYPVNDDYDKAKETYRKVKLLLEKGADASITNDMDQTALMLASDDNYKAKTVELLMKQS